MSKKFESQKFFAARYKELVAAAVLLVIGISSGIFSINLANTERDKQVLETVTIISEKLDFAEQVYQACQEDDLDEAICEQARLILERSK